MLYYRVKPEYDNKRLYRIKNGRYINCDDILIKNELYTIKEWEKLCKNYVFECSPSTCVELTEISKNNTYYFFGARFEIREAE